MKFPNKLISVNAKCRTKQHYLALGYEEIDGRFYVSCDDLPDKSGILETRKCDCCGKEFTRRHEYHVTTVKRFGKDVCGECVATLPDLRKIIQNKKDTAWKEKYGGHPMQTEDVKSKVNSTWEEKYGGHPMHNTEIYKKQQATVNKRYGGNSPMCNITVREKARETMYADGTTPISSQQLSLFNLLVEEYGEGNCTLNEPLSDLALDVSLNIQDCKIDIEYDGIYWHQDEQKDRRRDEFVKSQGYKVLRIRAKHKIPSLTQIKESIEYLITNDINFTQIVLE